MLQTNVVSNHQIRRVATNYSYSKAERWPVEALPGHGGNQPSDEVRL